jgi:hypothetical protein
MHGAARHLHRNAPLTSPTPRIRGRARWNPVRLAGHRSLAIREFVVERDWLSGAPNTTRPDIRRSQRVGVRSATVLVMDLDNVVLVVCVTCADGLFVVFADAGARHVIDEAPSFR